MTSQDTELSIIHNRYIIILKTIIHLALSNFSALARPNFSQPSSRIALVYQSVCSRMIADRL